MEAIEPALRKRKVEETIASSWSEEEEDEGFCSGFIQRALWDAAINKENPPSECSDDDDDSDIDPILDPDYYRQLRESGGFDVEPVPNCRMNVYKSTDEYGCTRDDMVGICARVGLHWYNFHKGSNLQLMRIDKYNSLFCALMTYFITAEATDPANDDPPLTFQTKVRMATCFNGEDLRIETEVCRIKPKILGTGDKTQVWDRDAVDDFYRGKLPEWILDNALPSPEFYEVQESEIRENDWLYMYTEFALYSLWERDMSCMPLEIKKVVVQTHEVVNSKEKLKAENAIFYISFKNLNAPAQDHRAIVRRTIDGFPGHVCLEFKCWVVDG